MIVVCLSIAGLAQDDPDGPGLFVGVLVLTLIGLLATLTYKLLKSHGRSTYQVSNMSYKRIKYLFSLGLGTSIQIQQG